MRPLRFPVNEKEKKDLLERITRIPVCVFMMHHNYGEETDRVCGDCDHFCAENLDLRLSDRYCELFEESYNKNVRHPLIWLKGWPDCGKFEEGEKKL